MVKKFIFPVILLLLGYGLFASKDFTTIAAGIAIFIVGMLYMEDGFKQLSGSSLSKILEKSTDTVSKSILSGFVATTVVQSSSLVSVIAISFLSAEIMTLAQAVGVIFGSNIGSTTTAWIVSAFGLKIKISLFAMPMLIFGVIFTFFQRTSVKVSGYILIGLGFIFLGISFMKDGFETLESGIDLSRFAMEGYAGLFIYILVGAAATVIIQSSGATMALIITAVASGQITYMNSLALAIGANVGTTITAILGALTSNENGKRLAAAHLIFNVSTAVFAVVFIYVLKDIVDWISALVGIGETDTAMKLSLFHTIFNVCGVILVLPFMDRLVSFLNGLFIYKGEKRGRPIYLDEDSIKNPHAALIAIRKEVEHLYDSVAHVIIQALRLHRHEVWSNQDLRQVVETVTRDPINVDQVYQERIKNLYGAILNYSTMAAAYMNDGEKHQAYEFKMVSRDIIEVVKEVRELQKNIAIYMRRNSPILREEYNKLREELAGILRNIYLIRHDPNDITAITSIEMVRDHIKEIDRSEIQRVSELIEQGKIDIKVAASLMNDSAFTRSIAQKLLNSAAVLWLTDETIKKLETDMRGGV